MTNFSFQNRKTKQKLKPKPAPEPPRPGAAVCSGKPIKSALAGLGAEFILRVFQKFCGEIRSSASRALSDA
jgi:hypothetical protein